MYFIVILLVAFAIVATLNWKFGSRRQCRWRADHARDKGQLKFYRCTACNAEAFTATKGPPRDCKQVLGKGSL